MQFSTITFPLLALFLTNTLAMPSSPNTNTNTLDSRSDSCYEDTSCSCGNVVPACNGAKVVGQTRCRCAGQDGKCDLVMCPDYSLKQVLVCGQSGTGCVWV